MMRKYDWLLPGRRWWRITSNAGTTWQMGMRSDHALVWATIRLGMKRPERTTTDAGQRRPGRIRGWAPTSATQVAKQLEQLTKSGNVSMDTIEHELEGVTRRNQAKEKDKDKNRDTDTAVKKLAEEATDLKERRNQLLP